jgi:hypothetical protein
LATPGTSGAGSTSGSFAAGRFVVMVSTINTRLRVGVDLDQVPPGSEAVMVLSDRYL